MTKQANDSVDGQIQERLPEFDNQHGKRKIENAFKSIAEPAKGSIAHVQSAIDLSENVSLIDPEIIQGKIAELKKQFNGRRKIALVRMADWNSL